MCRGVDSSVGAFTSDEDSGGARGSGAAATWPSRAVASSAREARREAVGDVVGVSQGDAGWDSYDWRRSTYEVEKSGYGLAPTQWRIAGITHIPRER